MSGFSAAATRFFQDLEDDNSREFWLANADVYEREVKQPMLALLESLPEQYQPFRLFRMNRDLRFTQGQVAVQDPAGRDLRGRGQRLLPAPRRQRPAGRRGRLP